MVDAHLVQQGGMHVMHADPIFNSVVAEVIGRAVGETWAEATAGKPHREAGQMVVAAIPLGHRRAAKL